jgi:hypothetical protein
LSDLYYSKRYGMSKLLLIAFFVSILLLYGYIFYLEIDLDKLEVTGHPGFRLCNEYSYASSRINGIKCFPVIGHFLSYSVGVMLIVMFSYGLAFLIPFCLILLFGLMYRKYYKRAETVL